MPEPVSQLVLAFVLLGFAWAGIELGVAWIDRAAHRADLDPSGE